MILEKLGAVGLFSALKTSGLLAFVAPAMALRPVSRSDAPAEAVQNTPAIAAAEGSQWAHVSRQFNGVSASARRAVALHDEATRCLAALDRDVAALKADLARQRTI